MKYSTQSNPGTNESFFIVSIDDKEWTSRADSSGKLKQFEHIVLSRLANIIVGYLFKHHKDELIKPILENVIEKVSKEVSTEILHRLGLPLEGNWDKK